MNIQKDVDRMRQAMKLAWDVAKDTNIDFVSIDVLLDPKDGMRPYVIGTVGDTQFMFTEDEGFTASYVPHTGNFDDWVCGYDAKRIESFKEPPKEKEP